MIKNIERQRAKKVYRKEKEEDPPGVSFLIKKYNEYKRQRKQKQLSFIGSISTCNNCL